MDRYKWLKDLNPTLVLDGGANEGQWLWYGKQLWPRASFICVEALPECAAKIPAGERVWVAQGALGERCGEVTFNRSSFSQSSSVLPMGKLHKDLFPFSKDHEPVTVGMTTMDAFFEGMKGPEVIKLDLQGYELEALKGGERVVSEAKALCIETSYVSLYDGQPLFGDIHKYLHDRGWVYRGCVEPPLCDERDGTPLEEDSWFVR